MLDFACRFAINDVRITICKGLLEYRAELRKLGVQGFQWLDGSFVEDVENFRPDRPQPADVDVVTFANFGPEHDQILNDLQSRSKDDYRVDGYFVSLTDLPSTIVEMTAYWFGLFGHRRADSAWKGMVQIDLGADDEVTETYLASRQWEGAP